jgi:Fic family protein
MDAIKYQTPPTWCYYEPSKVLQELVEAKGSVMSLTTIPFQRRWVDALQEVQLKLEVAGTSRIEGADFAGNELEQAMKETPEQLLTRSQRQAHAAVKTYRWIADLPEDRPISVELILDIHRMIVTDADDDHCPPGKLRGNDQNVIFGIPPHRGAEGGDGCKDAIQRLVAAINGEFRAHDPLIRALMTHYHFAAMHPFLDGNGRTARAIEALMLQRAGLRDALFIAMSNYYYDEKNSYLTTLAQVRANNFDLTPFIRFGLKGIALQTRRLADALRENISKELYRSLLHDLFTRLASPRKRVIVKRQIEIAEYLLKNGSTEFESFYSTIEPTYKSVSNPRKAVVRDLNNLARLGAIRIVKDEQNRFFLTAKLDWPSKITESEFFAKVKQMPTAKSHSFLATQ